MDNQTTAFEQCKTTTEIHAHLQRLAKELLTTIQNQGISPPEVFAENGTIDLSVFSELSYSGLKQYDHPVFLLSEISRLLFKLGDRQSLKHCLALSHMIYAFKCKQNESWYISYLYKGIAQIGLNLVDIGIKNVSIGLAEHPEFFLVPVDKALGYWALMSAAISGKNLKLAFTLAEKWQRTAQEGNVQGEIFRSNMVMLPLHLLPGEKETCGRKIQELMTGSSEEWEEAVNFLAEWTEAINKGKCIETTLFSEPYPLLLGIEWYRTPHPGPSTLRQAQDTASSGQAPLSREEREYDFRFLCEVRQKFCYKDIAHTLSIEELEQYARCMAQWELPLPLNEFEAVLKHKNTGTYFQQRLTRLLGKSILKNALSDATVHAHTTIRNEAILFVMDGRKYSALSEKCTPNELFDILNPIFKIMNEELERIGGTILEFVGDCIIVVFNIFDDRRAEIVEILSHTIRCLQRIHVLNALSLQTELPEIQTGVGIHKGPVALGYLGGLERCHLTVLGNTINVAARIETATKSLPGNVVISATCLNNRPPDFWKDPWKVNFACRDAGSDYKMKNISQPVHLFGLNPLIRTWVDFVPMGFHAHPENGIVYIDAGNAVESGIIDHHYPEAGANCSCEILIRQPELLLEHIRDTPISQLEFRFHDPPDLDCAASLYAAYEFIEAQELPDIEPRQDILEKLAGYMRQVNHARVPQPERLSDSLYGIYKAHDLLAQQKYGDVLTNTLRLEAGLRVVDAACYLMEQHPENSDFATIFQFQPDWFAEEKRLIEEDRDRYREDLKSRSHIYKARINGLPEPVTGIWLDHPQSLFFRIWAWNDPNAPGGEGYHFIALDISQPGKNRIFIGVNPDAGTNLRGLGELMEEHEIQKRKQLGKERPAHADRWYCGEGHKYGLIGSPGNGTILTPEEVQKIHESWE